MARKRPAKRAKKKASKRKPSTKRKAPKRKPPKKKRRATARWVPVSRPYIGERPSTYITGVAVPPGTPS
jgi:hypothetical protein